ncbi:hypothetical protein HJC23_004959 [Cyclotella cryptica]|uniref:Importin N-terminal domain-containing protein n=1 Tax=Cyclotella cryptica TaxID=29204 RepID=A0ABD3P892_9STRA|eukprot:CCRYP_016608-RA/>CCRYP_016608-RA protein AED:0.00 eAED:0.00 QI:39/-1/1/1/-1/1/1/116/1067
MPLSLPPPLPPPSASTLTLLSTLSNPNPADHSRHALALQARDDALSSPNYSEVCLDLCRLLACPSPSAVDASELRRWEEGDAEMFERCCGWMRPRDANANGNGNEAQQRQRQQQQGTTTWNTLRQMAGLSLKNALVSPPPPQNAPLDALGRVLPQHRARLSPPAAAEIQWGLLRCIADADGGVRSAASTAIARCCTAAASGTVQAMEDFGVGRWRELVPFLLECVACYNRRGGEGGQEDVVEVAAAAGALLTLRKLLEDIPNRMVRESPSSSLEELVPVLLTTMNNHHHQHHHNDQQQQQYQEQHESLRKEALTCLNCLIDPLPGALIAHMNSYLQTLSGLATDPSPGIRKLVCRGIVSLLNRRTEYIRPHISSIAEFMLRATADNDATVALEACEFWLTFASLDEEEDGCNDEMMGCVAALLSRLLPQLLRGMVYPPEKIEELMEMNALEEQEGADRAEDLAPVFHKSKVKGYHEDDDESNDDDDDDEFDDDNEWTLRKCSAASLDALSGLYGSSYILPPLLPALQEGLSHNDPWVREASILALGAIAEGCKDELAPHLPRLHPFLLSQLSSPESLPQLRCITAWTLGRYSSWVVDQMNAESDGDRSLVGCVAEALVGRLLDRNKKVQIAICSALGVFIEATGELMTPYLEPVLQEMVKALNVYRTRSLVVLFDTFGVMADCVGSAVGEGSLPGLYIPALLRRWNDMAMANLFDRALLPLMECMGSLTVACGMNFQPWALEAFEFSMSTIEACTLVISHEEGLAEDDELADPIICSVDLIDGLVEALGSNFVALVHGSSRFGPTFGNVLVTLSEHLIPGVRMSLFALLGDLARNAPSLIEAGLNQLLTEAISSIDPVHPSMCNNAVWAVGEVCVRCGENSGPLTPHASNLVQKLIPLLMGNAVDLDGNAIDVHGIAENAATTMGRLASVNPNFVAPDLGRFLVGWCTGMSRVSNLIERRDAFQGFVVALRTNPQSIQSAGPDLPDTISAILFAVVSWHIPQDDLSMDLLHSSYGFKPFPSEFGELLNSLRQLLHDIKASAGEACWNHVEGQMPVNVKRLMSEVYGI